MHRLPAWPSIAGLAAGVLLTVVPAGLAQLPKPEKVKFETYDQVELHGTFYPSAKGGAAPAVLLVHQVGGNRQKAGWDELAKKLQEEYAVLSFDLRGHNDSKEVGQLFWRYSQNLQGIKGANQNKKTIDYKEFTTTYYTHLVNDLTAAKRYLDQQDARQRCSSSNLIVIGAQDGAALASLWIATEFHRREPVLNAFGVPIPGQFGPPAGKDIACAVWLSFKPQVGGYRIPVENLFLQKAPEIREKVPMYFLYGDKDVGSKKTAQDLVSRLERGGKAKIPQTGYKEIPEMGVLAGAELLGKKGGDTEKFVAKYLEVILDKRGANPAQDRNLKLPLTAVPVSQFLR